MTDTKDDMKAHVSLAANTINHYIGNVRTMNDSTAYQYLSRLKDFQGFIENKYGFSVDKTGTAGCI